MRVLGSAVLGFEAVVVLLGIPVAAVTGTRWPTAAVLAGGVALIALLIVAIATITRPWGVAFGWVLQGIVIATGLAAPIMFGLGALFAVLWGVAVRFGRKADALRATRAAGPGSPALDRHGVARPEPPVG